MRARNLKMLRFLARSAMGFVVFCNLAAAAAAAAAATDASASASAPAAAAAGTPKKHANACAGTKRKRRGGSVGGKRREMILNKNDNNNDSKKKLATPQDSPVVTDQSTNWAHRGLTSQSGWDEVLYTRYDRKRLLGLAQSIFVSYIRSEVLSQANVWVGSFHICIVYPL